MAAPKVSVLIPTYNYAHYIDETISSVLEQSFQDFELIIIDDCSKDNTDEVMKKYETNSKISYFKNKQNLGLVGNWNECLSHAKGEYIKFLCADDKFHPLLLEKFVAVMEENKNVSLVTTFKYSFGKSNRSDEIVKLPLSGYHSGKEIIYNTLNHLGWLGEPSSVMFRRNNLQKTGNFKPNVIWLPDWEMWIRQLTIGDCYIIPEPLAIIRNHSGQLTKKVMKGFVNYFEEYDMCKAIAENKGYSIDLSGIDIQKVIKRKAQKCAIAMYKVIPLLHKKQSRIIFKKAFKIAWKENVLFYPFEKMVSSISSKPKTNNSNKQTLVA